MHARRGSGGVQLSGPSDARARAVGAVTGRQQRGGVCTTCSSRPVTSAPPASVRTSSANCSLCLDTVDTGPALDVPAQPTVMEAVGHTASLLQAQWDGMGTRERSAVLGGTEYGTHAAVPPPRHP